MGLFVPPLSSTSTGDLLKAMAGIRLWSIRVVLPAVPASNLILPPPSILGLNSTYSSLYAHDTAGSGIAPIKHGVLRSPSNMVNLNGVAYFRARSDSHGSELWRSDGTDAGTAVIDLSPGVADSMPLNIVSVNNKLFFYLWKDNPRKLYTAYLDDNGNVTANTIKVVKEINCEWLDVANNTLFFHVSGSDGGFYRSDGTSYGTIKLTSENVTGVGILNSRLLVNNLSSSTHALMATQATPTNVTWVGLRASYYGIQDGDANPPFGGDPGSTFDPDYDFPAPGQWEAAASIGLSRYRIFRHIILPQALAKMIPPLAGQTISLIKDSALVSTIALYDLTMEAQSIIAETYMVFELWITVAVLYLGLTLSLSLITRHMEARASLDNS